MERTVQIPHEDAPAELISPRFPTLQEVDLLKEIILLSPEDERILRKAWRHLAGQADDCLDRLLGLLAAHPSLRQALTGACENQSAYIEVIRREFRQWLFDTCLRPHEAQWLKKYYACPEASLLPSFRYIPAVIYPLLATILPFLYTGASDESEFQRLQQALLKSLLLQAVLASKVYVTEGRW